MAKGNAFIGVVSGKLGSTVGFKISNPAGKEVQGWRPYQPNVNNPRTEPQAIQRLKMAPAVNFYRHLSQVLNNAWQGEKYGNVSRRHFMSLAMTQSTGIPFIVKGDKRFFPGEYPVSQGSLTRLSVTGIENNRLVTSLTLERFNETWGEFSQGIINKNFGIKHGDKLTFIFVGTTSTGDFLPVYSYVILDTTMTTPAAEILASSNLDFYGNDDAPLQVGVLNAVSDIVAGAVILSRLDGTTGTKWLRSNSDMFCSESYKAVWMGAQAYQAAMASYMNTENLSSDWYLNAGLNGGYSWIGPGGNSGTNLSVVSVDNIFVNFSGSVQTEVAIATMSDGSKRAYRNNDSAPVILGRSGSTWVITTKPATEANLNIIKNVEPLVTGWIIVNVENTVIEEP